MCDPELVRRRAHDLVATSNEFLAASWHNAAAGNATPIDLGAAAYRTLDEVRRTADGLDVAWWTAGPFGLAVTASWTTASPRTTPVERLDAIALPIPTSAPAYRGDGAGARGRDLRDGAGRGSPGRGA